MYMIFTEGSQRVGGGRAKFKENPLKCTCSLQALMPGSGTRHEWSMSLFVGFSCFQLFCCYILKLRKHQVLVSIMCISVCVGTSTRVCVFLRLQHLSDPAVFPLPGVELSSIINPLRRSNVCMSVSGSLLALTFDRDVSEQTLFLPAASALSLTHIMTFILQPDGADGEV